MANIIIHCDCGRQHEVTRDKEAPEAAISMGCNWCPACEDTAEDYYNEWYNFNGSGEAESDDPNQLMMFSITDEILHKEPEKQIYGS